MKLKVKKNKAGQQLLKQYKKKLRTAKTDYANSNHSGHPEEQLELIESHQNMVRSIEQARARGWTPNLILVESAREGIVWWETHVPLPKDEARYVEVLDQYKQTLAWAEAGLI